MAVATRMILRGIRTMWVMVCSKTAKWILTSWSVTDNTVAPELTEMTEPPELTELTDLTEPPELTELTELTEMTETPELTELTENHPMDLV